MGSSLGATGLSEQSLSKRSAMAGNHDRLYLFGCHWSRNTGETLEVIRHSLPHWTIPIRGSA